MNTLTLHSGEIIFRQKDFAESMFDIVSGKVGIFSNYGTDTETKITELGEGQTFGEMGMIEYFPRSATAVALEETILAEIKEEELKTMYDKWLFVLHNLSRLMKRPAALQERIFTRLFEQAEIARYTPEERQDYEDSLKVYRDMKNVLDTAELKGLKKGIEQRDYQDMNRDIAPLKQAEDAVYLDTSDMDISEVVDKIIQLKKEAEK